MRMAKTRPNSRKAAMISAISSSTRITVCGGPDDADPAQGLPGEMLDRRDGSHHQIEQADQQVQDHAGGVLHLVSADGGSGGNSGGAAKFSRGRGRR